MTKGMRVLLAAKALVTAALPDAAIAGFDKDADKPQRIGAGGCVVGHPGDPGEPDVDLSPLTFNYSHRIPVEIIGPNGKGGADLDAMLEALGTAVAADPTLGGECYYFGLEAPDFNDRSTEVVASTNWANLYLVAEYSTNSALR